MPLNVKFALNPPDRKLLMHCYNVTFDYIKVKRPNVVIWVILVFVEALSLSH